MREKLLRALGPTGRTRGAASARSKIIIMHNLLLFGEHKMQGVILIPESININQWHRWARLSLRVVTH